MPDEPPATDSAYRVTRRGLLAAAGVSAVAGCSSIDGLSSGTEPTIRAYDLPDIDSESVPEPVESGGITRRHQSLPPNSIRGSIMVYTTSVTSRSTTMSTPSV